MYMSDLQGHAESVDEHAIRFPERDDQQDLEVLEQSDEDVEASTIDSCERDGPA